MLAVHNGGPGGTDGRYLSRVPVDLARVPPDLCPICRDYPNGTRDKKGQAVRDADGDHAIARQRATSPMPRHRHRPPGSMTFTRSGPEPGASGERVGLASPLLLLARGCPSVLNR